MFSYSKRNRPRRPHELIFYSTALIVTLFTCYSLILSSWNLDPQSEARILLRSLDTTDIECRLVNQAQDKCAFVRANCPDEEAGLISYLQLYYCSLSDAKPLAFTILVIWISLLFSTIGIAASDFLSVNLSTIATVLGMSESLTGVTFLAFGNGSPDVFSTFAAMSSNSGSLAVGELMGAAGFITAVVAGSMALVKPFRVARKSFVRDVGFFMIAASFSLVFLNDGNLRLWECVTMVAFYVFYVVFVVLWHWWLQRSRRIKLAEAVARLHHHIPGHQELEIPNIEVDEESAPAGERTNLLRADSTNSVHTLLSPNIPAWKLQVDDEDDDETRDRYLAGLQSNMRVSRAGGRDRRNTITPIRPSLVGALEFRSVLHSLEKKATTNRQAIGLRGYSGDGSYFDYTHTAASQPQLSLPDSTSRNPVPHPSPIRGRNRSVSANDASGLHLDRDNLLISMSPVRELSRSPSDGQVGGSTHRHTQSDVTQSGFLSVMPGSQEMLSPTAISPLSGPAVTSASPYSANNGYLAPPGTAFNRPDWEEGAHNIQPSPLLSPRMDVPILKVPSPSSRKSPVVSQLGSPASSHSRSRASSIHLPPPNLSLSPEASESLALLQHDSEEDIEFRFYPWWPYKYLPAPQIMLATLFPTLYGWKEKSLFGKVFGVVTAPLVFLLTITLPVVESSEDQSNQDDLLSPEVAAIARRDTVTQADFDLAASATNTDQTQLTETQNDVPGGRKMSGFATPVDANNSNDDLNREWNRWLFIVQIFTAPICVALIVWANLDETHTKKELLVLVLSCLVFSLICLLLLLATTSPDRVPRLRPIFCFLGFTVAIAWISTIANEVVGVLKAFGVILNISDAILGLTIFAVGNSLGDLVADITVAKLGYPVMALSACFGGPMLNILLGIGCGGMYMTIHKGQQRHHKHPNRPIKYEPYELEVSSTLMISGITLLVTLVGLLIFVPLNNWRMDRKIGIGLIALWTVSSIGNVVLEVLGIGSEWLSSKN